MFTLTLTINSTNIEAIKADLRRSLPDIKSSHRCEAIARGFGFKTYAAMLAATRSGESVNSTADGSKFCSYLHSACKIDSRPKPFYLAAVRVVIVAALEKEPRLFYRGFGFGRPIRKQDGKFESPREQYERLIARNDQLLSDDGAEQVLRSIALLGAVPKSRTIRPDSDSYRLKHIAEEYVCTYPEGDRLGSNYVSSGALIAAAIHCGFKYKTYRDELGYEILTVSFNMAKSVLDDLDCKIRPNGARAQARRRREQARRQLEKEKSLLEQYRLADRALRYSA